MKKLACMFGLIVLSAGVALGNTYTWSGAAVDDNSWDTPENWAGNEVPPNDGSASLIFGNTGAGTVEYGTTTREFANLTIQGNQAYTFAGTGGGELSWTGEFRNEATDGQQLIQDNTALTGTGSMFLTRSLRLGSFANLGTREITFSGGVTAANGASLIVQYGNPGTGTEYKPLAGTGAFQAGTGLLNTSGGAFVVNQISTARMTYANDFVNAVTRDGEFGSNQFQIRHAGGLGVADPTTTRYTGDFSTAELPDGAGGHGWTLARGRDVTDGSRPFGAATLEFSGDWSNYQALSTRITFDHGAFVIAGTNSVATESVYHLNSNSAGAQSTVLALGVDGVNFNRIINIENAATGGSSAADAVNQTYIGGRQEGTALYSANIAFVRAGDHRLNLFSETGRTEFGANLVAAADKVVAINSPYSMTTYTDINEIGLTTGNELREFEPSGTVAFTGGTKTFNGGLVVIDGTLLINQTITGDVTVDEGATIGTEGSGEIDGDLHLEAGAQIQFSLAALEVTGEATFGGLSIENVVGLDGTVDTGTYTLIDGDVDMANVNDVGVENAVSIGGGKSAYFEENSLEVVVISDEPEPNPVPVQQFVAEAGEPVFVRFVGEDGVTYGLEYTTDLTDPEGWEPVDGATATGDGMTLLTVEDDNPVDAMRFYRLILVVE